MNYFSCPVRKQIPFYLLLVTCLWLASCTTKAPTAVTVPGAPIVMEGVLTTPAALFSPAQYHTVIHEVGPMETIWRIAKTYDVDIQSIMRANHLTDPNQINTGQKLKIPDTRGMRPVIPLYKTRPWDYIVIHHTATEIGNAMFIDKTHHNRGFWDGLGYHFLIDNGSLGKLDGQIEISPRWVKQKDGAHCNVAGMNQHGIGIALVGNFSQERVSKQQLDSLVFLTKVLMQYYKVPISHVMRHGEVPGKHTECPGKHFPWNEFLSRLQKEG